MARTGTRCSGRRDIQPCVARFRRWASPTVPPGGQTYIVQDGDSGFAIADAFGITIDALAEANGMTVADLDNLQIGQEIIIPLKNAEGGYIASNETLDRIEGEGLVAFRYAGVNPNGSLRDIAGLTNTAGNVVGLMPHPEHATEPGFGPDTSVAMRSGVDGLPFFTSAIAAVARVAA